MKKKIHKIYWADYDTYLIGHFKCWIEVDKFPTRLSNGWEDRFQVRLRNKLTKKYITDKQYYETPGGARDALLRLLANEAF